MPAIAMIGRRSIPAAIFGFHRRLKRPEGVFVTAPIPFVAMAHFYPIRNHQRIITLAVRPQNAGINVIDAIAKMVAQLFIKSVVKFDRSRIKDRQIIGFLAMFEAAHEGAPILLLVAQPNWREMQPVINNIAEPSLV